MSAGSKYLNRALSKQIFTITDSAANRLKYLALHHLKHSNDNNNNDHMKNEGSLPLQRSIQLNDSKSMCRLPAVQSGSMSLPAIKISLITKGCSGLSYNFTFTEPLVKKENAADEIIETKNGLQLIVDSEAVLFVIGTVMDFIEEPLGCRFTFKNPNQRTACGCGKSFSV